MVYHKFVLTRKKKLILLRKIICYDPVLIIPHHEELYQLSYVGLIDVKLQADFEPCVLAMLF